MISYSQYWIFFGTPSKGVAVMIEIFGKIATFLSSLQAQFVTK